MDSLTWLVVGAGIWLGAQLGPRVSLVGPSSWILGLPQSMAAGFLEGKLQGEGSRNWDLVRPGLGSPRMLLLPRSPGQCPRARLDAKEGEINSPSRWGNKTCT